MQRASLGGIDINLIVALHALLRERNVTRAARAVGLGQSSMSHALGRLRARFEDPLLVPAGRSLVLTERGRSLIEPVEAAVRSLEVVFAPPAVFDPRTSDRTFHIAVTDNLGLYLLPRLATVLAREAPRIALRVHHLPADWPAALDSGAIDLKLGRKYPLPARFHAQDLFGDRLVCAVRRGLALPRKLTLERYAALSHVVVAPRDAARESGDRSSGAGLGSQISEKSARSPVDEALAQRGLMRRVMLTVPHFLVAPFIVAESDLALTAPERLLTRFVAPLRLRLVPLPLRLPGHTLSQVWSERSHADEGHAWLRATIARVLAT